MKTILLYLITILFLLLSLVILAFIPCHASTITLPAHEQKILSEVADEYGLCGDSRLLLFVIRKVENGRIYLEKKKTIYIVKNLVYYGTNKEVQKWLQKNAPNVLKKNLYKSFIRDVGNAKNVLQRKGKNIGKKINILLLSKEEIISEKTEKNIFNKKEKNIKEIVKSIKKAQKNGDLEILIKLTNMKKKDGMKNKKYSKTILKSKLEENVQFAGIRKIYQFLNGIIKMKKKKILSLEKRESHFETIQCFKKKSENVFCYVVIVTKKNIFHHQNLSHYQIEFSKDLKTMELIFYEDRGISMGVLHPKAVNTSFRNQCQWTAGTIAKRYTGDLMAFSNRWCPIGASNDPTGLNQNWYKNARYYMNKWR